jgi:hypothetical protein
MTTQPDNFEDKQEKFRTYFPVLIFIALIFVLEVFQVQKATSLVVSVIISLFIYGIMAARLKEQHGNLPEFKPLNLYLGFLTLMLILIIIIAVIHWFQLLHINLRWMLFFIALLVYFIVLFRAVHTIHDLKMSLKDTTK